ncbi:Yhp1p KNAG_0C02770 [Huiozyma naganishii CBS 8797]|uniref:Homeobox domain-containing protein n=1 Tax=Huiozyma naganishii (strain ATCC MYA-139 / BCRC 22969 / CBS 8797 / KCTC 17520 / NBRC 10181 / NCYC 3082 / Yp74L-3) TaxID=1071383 RepID=J7RIN8_HUIN7|nr:hypothetical protein KNAG_0C02770 [Kazachstania naganishii CBS 8797]CCK69388.1 hypothetical protein KNAG_0C02770 [Kazachstania naganishii CBS 8797]
MLANGTVPGSYNPVTGYFIPQYDMQPQQPQQQIIYEQRPQEYGMQPEIRIFVPSNGVQLPSFHSIMGGVPPATAAAAAPYQTYTQPPPPQQPHAQVQYQIQPQLNRGIQLQPQYLPQQSFVVNQGRMVPEFQKPGLELGHLVTPPHSPDGQDNLKCKTTGKSSERRSSSVSSTSSALAASPESSSSSSRKRFSFITHSKETFPKKLINGEEVSSKPKRRRTTKEQKDILKKAFERNKAPNKQEKLELAKKCNMSEKAIQVWFQNQRQYIRKEQALLAGRYQLTLNGFPHSPYSDTSSNRRPMPEGSGANYPAGNYILTNQM